MKFDILKPAMGASNTITVTGRPGVDAIELSINTDADAIEMTTPGSSPVILIPTNGRYQGYISTIPATAKAFMFTATKGSEQAVKIITLAPDAAPVSPSPTPTPAKEVFATLYKDGTWVKA